MGVRTFPTKSTPPICLLHRDLYFRSVASETVNREPTSIFALGDLNISENQSIGTIVGEFNATDPDGGAVTYSLVSGDGFTMDANGTLKTSWQLDYEAGSVRTIVVQAKDEMNATVEGTFTVSITNVNEAPVMGGAVNLSISESENLFNIPTTWDRTFGGTGEDRLRASIKTSDGGYLLCGYSESNATVDKSQNSRGGKDYWVVKLDALGNKLWDRTFGGSGEDRCNGAIELAEKGYLIFGESTSTAGADRSSQTKGNQDFWVVRIDINGSILWDKAYGGSQYEYCMDVIPTADGGYLLGGSTSTWSGGDLSQTSRGESDFWIVKTDANGSKLWDKRFGGSGAESLKQILATPDGGYLLGGYSLSDLSGDKSENSKGKSDFWIIKTDANGSKIWDRTYGGSGDEWHPKLLPAKDGGFLLTGSSESNATGDKSETSGGYYSYWSVRIDENGTKLWDKTFSSNGDEWNTAAIATNDGNFVLVGRAWGQGASGDRSEASHGNSDYWVLKIDDRGSILWDKNLGGTWDDWGESVLATSDGGYLVGGDSWSSIGYDKSEVRRGDRDYWIVKTDAEGNRNHHATDPEGDTLAWSISGGADSYKFIINAATGELTFNSADFEDPQDADANNTYEVTIRATDSGGLFGEQSISIEVEDVFEPSRENHFLELNSTVDLEMIWVEPGTFTMGVQNRKLAEIHESEHNVTLTKGFYLGKYEVTQAQYEAVMAGNRRWDFSATPSQWPNNPDRPVEKVSWNDIQVFLSRLNEQQADNLPGGWTYVLPTEAQWEYACRAGTTTTYFWGNGINSTRANYNWDGAHNTGSDFSQTRDVGQYSANPWGFFDMSGNAYEWTNNWDNQYSGGHLIDPEGPAEGSQKVTRGGSWGNSGELLRSASRSKWTPAGRSETLGFRLSFQYTNKSPIDLNSTTDLTIAENQPAGTIVGEFNATDPEGGAITYSLVSGEGDAG